MTGQSKDYGFLKFDSSTVAQLQIVADTMDNYLLMGHILWCKVIPREMKCIPNSGLALTANGGPFQKIASPAWNTIRSVYSVRFRALLGPLHAVFVVQCDAVNGVCGLVAEGDLAGWGGTEGRWGFSY
jgi:hypothetical protein